MALSFQWDPIAFRKATAGWPKSAKYIYRDLIDWLHLNDGSLSDGMLWRGWKDHDWDRKTWKRSIQFLVDKGKLSQNAEGEWVNGRVARDHARITGRSGAKSGHDGAQLGQVGANPGKNPNDNSTKSKASTPPLQVTGIQETDNSNTPPVVPPKGGKRRRNLNHSEKLIDLRTKFTLESQEQETDEGQQAVGSGQRDSAGVPSRVPVAVRSRK